MNEQAKLQQDYRELDHHWVLPIVRAHSSLEPGSSVKFLRFHEIAEEEDNSHQVVEIWDEIHDLDTSAGWQDFGLICWAACLTMIISVAVSLSYGPPAGYEEPLPMVVQQLPAVLDHTERFSDAMRALTEGE